MTTALTLDSQTGTQHELATAKDAASAQHEIQSAIIIARKFPRNEDAAFQKLMRSAGRPSFAEDATYSFPRGDKTVTGPSVNLAREAARIWGNIRFGLYVVRDDEETRLIRGFAYDVESNVKVEVEDDFKKLIQRKVKGSNPPRTEWLVPDERDLRELTNRRGAILLRNALLQVLPKDLIEDALYQCGKTLEKDAGEHPEAVRKRLLVDLGAFNVTVEQIEKALGHPFALSTPAELTDLRAICTSIRDGNSSWQEYMKRHDAPAEKTAEQTAADDAAKAALAKGQEELKKKQEQPKQSDPKLDEKKPMTCKQACEKLELVQSPKELAEVMNTWQENTESTSEERRTVLDHKDRAMRRLSEGSKKKK